MQILQHSINGRLARRMSIYVILASTLITIFTSSIQIYFEFQREVSNVTAGLEQIEQTHLSNITSRIWVLDLEELKTTLNSLLSLPSIEHVAAYENDELLVTAGKKNSTNIIVKNYPLIHSRDNIRTKIGNLIVTASLDLAYQHVLERAIVILASNAVKTFIIAGLILLIFYKLVAQHLAAIAKYAENLDIHTLDSRFEFNRKTRLPDKLDELDLLKMALDKMQGNLLSAMQDLTDSQAQVHLLLNSTAEAIYGINTKGECTFLNKSCLDLLGYADSAELLGQNTHEHIHHSHVDGTHYRLADNPIYKSYKEQIPVHIDDEVLWRKDGSYFNAEYWSHPIFQEERCIGAVVTFLNINERIEAVNALKERERDLEITLNSIGDAVITTDAQGLITRMNPVAERLTGWSLSESRNKPLTSIFPILNSSTREPIANPIEKVISTGEIVFLSHHTTLLSKDGAEYQIADSAAPLRTEDNSIVGMVLVFNDVTEQQQARQALLNKEYEQREILNCMLDAVITIDQQGTLLSFNHAAETLFGYSIDEIVGQNVSILMAANHASEHDNYIQQFLHTGESQVVGPGREVEAQRKSKDSFPMRLTVAELSKDEKGTRRFIGSCLDLSQIKLQEMQLRRSEKMDALGKLTGGISHDYNNMLGVILGYADLLEVALKSQPKLAYYAHQIHHAGTRGAKLTRKLLAFSHHSASDAQILDINEILHEERHMLEKSLTARIKLELILEEKIWPIWLDDSDLEDAILNLGINAMHAMESGGNLTIQTKNERIDEIGSRHLEIEAGDFVSLSFTDTGCGMDNKTKEKIFDPFFSTKGTQGTGLGLSQVYGFMERSGGAIKVYSEVGQGTRISLYFPRYYNKALTSESSASSKMKAFGGHETILIVDDEPSLLELTSDILSQRGYKTLRATLGKEALELLSKNPVDLMLSDVIMPEMDGYELAEIVQKKYPKLKIQLSSGFNDVRHVDLTKPSLHNNLLCKPYNTQELLLRIRKLLDN
ncbi:MAG: PAS domain S-box protein [Thiohalomonadales bacterium]